MEKKFSKTPEYIHEIDRTVGIPLDVKLECNVYLVKASINIYQCWFELGSVYLKGSMDYIKLPHLKTIQDKIIITH